MMKRRKNIHITTNRMYFITLLKLEERQLSYKKIWMPWCNLSVKLSEVKALILHQCKDPLHHLVLLRNSQQLFCRQPRSSGKLHLGLRRPCPRLILLDLSWDNFINKETDL